MTKELHAQTPEIHNLFYTGEIPDISIINYMDRLKIYCHVDNYEMAYAHIYVGRLIDRGIVLSDFNIYNIMITCLVLAIKYLNDVWYSNKYYALVGCIDLENLNIFELEVAFLLDWDFGLNSVHKLGNDDGL
jgi:hypothetical protein